MTLLLPYNETERLSALYEHAVLDTGTERVYDDIASFAACICGTPMAAVILIDSERLYLKSAIGLDVSETPREISFCTHTILQQGIMVVPDARNDRRFADHPQVTGNASICFYAGVPVLSADGLPLGTLCVMDRVPRQLTPEQLEALRTLGRQVERQLALRRSTLAAVSVPSQTIPSDLQASNSVEIQAVIAAWQKVESQYQEAYRSGHSSEKDTASAGEEQSSSSSGLPASLEWVARGLQARVETLLNGSPMRLLYVDDDGMDRLAVRRALKRSDLHADLREVETYAAALAVLEEEKFDCLLIDYSLPDGDGFSLLLELRALGFSLPVIMLTGHGDERLAVESVRAGAADYLPKAGLTPLLLSHRLRSAVRVHQAQQERKAQAQQERKAQAQREAAEHVAVLERQKKELEKTLLEAEEWVCHDPLTSLFNHRVFHIRLAAEAARAEREGTTLAVVMLDVDNFKFFNDVYSHATGDEVLRHVADRLQEVCWPYDTIARFGGDEFALLLPHVGDVSAAQIEARLQADMQDITYPLNEQEIPITVSAGAALFPKNGMDRSEVVSLADERLQRAKTGSALETEADQVRRRIGHSLEGFSMLDALVTAVDNKDRYTRRHSEDVMEYSLMIARELELDEEVQQTIGIAALLHDVGKIGVPDAILRKPGKLTDQEFNAIKQHPAMGAAIVGAVSGLEKTLDAVYHHHERWDGKGYPLGLRGNETPLIARLMAIADAFSAMTTDRPYHKGMSRKEAISILEAGAGSQWDPHCVAAFQKAQRTQQASRAESAEGSIRPLASVLD